MHAVVNMGTIILQSHEHYYSARTHCSASLKICSLARIKMACVCGRAMAAGATHALICGALWHTVVARHNMMLDAWRSCRLFARAGISSSLDPHVKQLPHTLRAAGVPVCPSRSTGSHPRDSNAACATPSSYKRVKGRSHTVEKRKASHPQKPHATSQPSRFVHTPTLSTDAAHN